MAGVGHPGTMTPDAPTVHNDGQSPVFVRLVVDGAVRSVTLAPGESHAVSAPAGARVEVYTDESSATALAGRGPFFVVRDGRVLVAPG